MSELLAGHRYRRTRLAAALALTLVFWFQRMPNSFGTWVSSPAPPSMAVSTATLVPPIGLTAANGTCIASVSIQVNLAWTTTTSTFADGYQIFRSTTSGGPYSAIGSVTGLTTTTFTDATVAFSTTYYYVVQATKNNWRSANSTQSSVLTLSALCA